jgi:UDP-N-acetyl-2-amino-2-deoxyglucuronate dehydrogenase
VERKVGFGIIGTGNIAKFHADCIEKIPNAKLLGVLSKSENRAHQLAEHYNCPVFWEMDKLLAVAGIEVICICNESGMHGATIAEIAKAGKNILCEKPLEITVEKIDQITEVVNYSGVKLGCVFQNRENPEYQKLKRYVQEGVLGKLLLCQTGVNWYRPPGYYENSWRGTHILDGGAAFINQGIHTIDLMLDLMGEVSEVSGFIDTLHHSIEGEDVGVAALKFKSGALGTLSCGTALFPGEPEYLTLYGSSGNISFKGGKIVSSSIDSINQELNAFQNETGSGASDPMAITDQFHIAVIEDMINVVLHDKAPKVNTKEAKKSVALINAIYQSKGNRIKLE